MKYQKFIHQFFRDLTSLGSFVFFSIIILLTLAFQKHPLTIKLIFGLISTLLIVILIRIFYFKNRPKKQNHHNFIERIDASSFPSLHTARVVFLALIFNQSFPTPLTITFFTTIAVFTAYSRIYLKKHDWYDLFGGLILGLIAFYITTFF
jgi:membrane-associated phospholipid phosphatase